MFPTITIVVQRLKYVSNDYDLCVYSCMHAWLGSNSFLAIVQQLAIVLKFCYCMLSAVRMSDLSTASALLGWLLYIGKVCGHIVDCAETMQEIISNARKVGRYLAKGFSFCISLPRALWRRVSMCGSRFRSSMASLFRSRVDAATQTLCRYRIRNPPASIGTQTDMHFHRSRGLVIDRGLSTWERSVDRVV